MPDAVIFDMDGLLFDTKALYLEAVGFAAAEYGRDFEPGFLLRTVGLPWTECRELFLSQLGKGFPADPFLATWQRHFGLIAESRLTVKPGAIDRCKTWEAVGRGGADRLPFRARCRAQGLASLV